MIPGKVLRVLSLLLFIFIFVKDSKCLEEANTILDPKDTLSNKANDISRVRNANLETISGISRLPTKSLFTRRQIKHISEQWRNSILKQIEFRREKFGDDDEEVKILLEQLKTEEEIRQKYL